MRQSPSRTGFTHWKSDVEAAAERGYFILRKIDVASTANVHIAEYQDPYNGKCQKLACKVCEVNSARVLSEVAILCQLKNPHVIQVHSICQRGPRVFIFTKYEENGNLLDFLRKYGRMKEQHASEWFRQIASGLQYLHSKEIAHRDLKCEHILISENYNIKITDFGLSRHCVDQNNYRILSRTFWGSTVYAAPEVVSNTPYNPKLADVWSLGVILYIMLTAIMPFAAHSYKKLLKEQLERNWAFQPEMQYLSSQSVKSLLNQMLEPDLLKRLTVDLILSHDWLSSSSTLLSGSTSPSWPPVLLEGGDSVRQPVTDNTLYFSDEHHM